MYPIIDELRKELDATCDADDNLQHILYMFAGYRAGVTDDEETQPYSPGSARDASWQHGRQIAITDMNNNRKGRI